MNNFCPMNMGQSSEIRRISHSLQYHFQAYRSERVNKCSIANYRRNDVNDESLKIVYVEIKVLLLSPYFVLFLHLYEFVIYE